MSEEEHDKDEFYYPEYPDEQEKDENFHNDNIVNDADIVPNSQEELAKFVQEQKSKNTVKKTSSDMNAFYRYLAQINRKDTNIIDLPAEALNHLLAKFFKDVRKLGGEEYEPGTLTGFQRSLQRFLADSGSNFNILKDEEFLFSRKVLEAKRKNLVLQGKGNKPNATRSLTSEEEEKLFKSGEFGTENPASLQRAMWWFLSLHFGFRARDESRKLCWGDVVLQSDPVQDGREMLVWVSERGSKTRKGAENGHQRPFCPKVYATNTDRCPVQFYKLFKSHRPSEMNEPNSPFFLAIRHGERRQNPHIWYMKAPLGKNEIGKFLTTAATNAGLQREGGKVANHSVRKTSIGRLLDANTPETFVAQLSGHKNIQSLQSYKSANDDHQRQMSYILSHASKQPNLPLPSTESQSQIIATTSDGQRKYESTYSQSLAISNASTQAAQSHGIFSGATIKSMNDCHFQVFNGPVKIVQQSRKRRYIIESDDEED